MGEEKTTQALERNDNDKLVEREPVAPAETNPPQSSEAVSDVMLAESETGKAPSFRAPAQPPPRPDASPAPGVDAVTAKRAAPDQRPMALLPGAKVDDFEIIRLLGRGAFGHVYLARQVSLDRQVALKISANRGSEGRTMARLEHQHIVQVFSETVEPEFNQRLLCMQLVPGIGLDKLIGLLHGEKKSGKSPPAPPEWNGRELLAIIDGAASLPAALDPSALHDREALAHMDAIEATAWFGARLAEALDFAHRHGVLHRDIKPANILVNPYGRPMLADFNISSQPVGSEPGGEEMFGGTFGYMAPEHLDAFNPTDSTTADAVTARSDLFSLALVLQQLLAGRMTFSLPKRNENIVQTLRTMADDRRRPRLECDPGPPGAHQTLRRTIGRCLAPDPDDRLASGAELAEQLDGCRRLRQAEQQLPPLSKMLAPVLRHPFFWLVMLVILPQAVGSIVNIAYNKTQIVENLTASQKITFKYLVIGYNAIVYPAAVALFLIAIRPVLRCWRALENAHPLAEGQVTAARQQALQLPNWIAVLTAGGWFPGGIVFPMFFMLTSGLDFRLAAQFFVSFYLSGLIALAYSLCGAQFVVLRALYPRMWRDVRSFGETTRRELAPMAARLNYILLLAVAIPLVAAILNLWLGGDAAGGTFFKMLVTALIVFGIIGLSVASRTTRSLSKVIAALTSTKA